MPDPESDNDGEDEDDNDDNSSSLCHGFCVPAADRYPVSDLWLSAIFPARVSVWGTLSFLGRPGRGLR